MPTEIEDAMFFLNLRIRYWNVTKYYASDIELTNVFRNEVEDFYRSFKEFKMENLE